MATEEKCNFGFSQNTNESVLFEDVKVNTVQTNLLSKP